MKLNMTCDMFFPRQVGSKFPSSRFEVVNKMVFPYGEMSPEEVGVKIAAHCAGMKLVKVLVTDEQNMNQKITEMVQSGG